MGAPATTRNFSGYANYDDHDDDDDDDDDCVTLTTLTTSYNLLFVSSFISDSDDEYRLIGPAAGRPGRVLIRLLQIII